MAIALLKTLFGAWEQVRGGLFDDLERIEMGLNQPTQASSLVGTLPINVLPNVPAGTLLGRGSTSGSGPAEEIDLGPGLYMDGTTLRVSPSALGVSGGRRSASSGEETGRRGGPPNSPITFTPGSVLFAGPTGLPAQDNANFFWDDTNDRLGIGTNAPTSQLHVVGSAEFHNITDVTGANGGFRVSGGFGVAPAAGAGVEIFYNGSAGVVQAYNRGGAAWIPLTQQGLSYSLSVQANQDILFTTSGTGKLETSGPFQADSSLTVASYLRVGAADATAPAAGDIVANRGGDPGSGVVFFGGSANAHYLFYDGTNFNFVGCPILTISGDIKTGNATFLHRTSVALTNNAAANAGTLLNAPAAGNPTKWIAIDDNGTTRYIPAW